MWTVDLLTEILKSAGFEVEVLDPGVSEHTHLQSLERRSDRDEHPFDLLGTVCMEAKKPAYRPKSDRPPPISVSFPRISGMIAWLLSSRIVHARGTTFSRLPLFTLTPSAMGLNAESLGNGRKKP